MEDANAGSNFKNIRTCNMLADHISVLQMATLPCVQMIPLFYPYDDECHERTQIRGILKFQEE